MVKRSKGLSDPISAKNLELAIFYTNTLTPSSKNKTETDASSLVPRLL